MKQRVNASSGGGVPLPSQEMGSMTVNQHLVVAPPGYSKKTSGLLVRVISALIDAIRNGCLRYHAGLFFNPRKVKQALGQFDVVAHENDGLKRLEEKKKLEKLLQGLSDKGVHYILGEFIKEVSGSVTAGCDDFLKIKARVDLFDELCGKKYRQLQASFGNEVSRSEGLPIIRFIDESILDRLNGREKVEIYNVLRGYSSTFMRCLVRSFRDNFKEYARLSGSLSGMSSLVKRGNIGLGIELSLLKETPHNIEQAFCLLGDIAKHVLVEGHGCHGGTMEDNVNAFNELFEIFYEKSSFINDGCSLQNCALWVLNQLEEKDREKAIGVLGEYGSVLVKGLV